MPFTILDITAPEADINARLASRKRNGNSVSEAGAEELSAQRQHQETLTEDELQFARSVPNLQGAEPPLGEHLPDLRLDQMPRRALHGRERIPPEGEAQIGAAAPAGTISP